MTPEEYFKKWSENCRLFINYKPIHSHEDMMQFAKDYHTEQLRISDVVDRTEQLPICKCENTERVNVGSGSWNIHCKDCGKNW